VVAGTRRTVIKRNVLANMLGSGWGMILQFILVPVQIRFLSVEAYGLLAFLASVQIIFNLFDLGLSPTITREVAGDQSPDLRHSLNLVQSLSLVYCAIGVVLGLSFAVAAPLIATDWLKLESLSTDTAILALQLGALAILIRWPVTFYGGVIGGRQRFVLLNLLGAGLATVFLVITIAVVWLSHSLVALMIWRVISAVLELTLVVFLCHRLLPGLTLRPQAPMAAVKHVWRFAGGMNALNIQALVLTQGDRFLISRILPISALGYYAVAYGTAQTLVSIQGTVSSAMFPAFSASHGRGKVELLATHCTKAAQLVTFYVAFPALILAFFGFDILRVWIGIETAQESYLPLAVLAVAFLINAPLGILALLAIATDHVATVLRINIVGLIGWVPCMFLLTTRFALTGAAMTFLLLHIYYLIVMPPLLLRILGQPRPAAWLGRNVLPFVAIGLATVGTAKAFVTTRDTDVIVEVIAIGLAGVAYLVTAFLALHSDFQSLGRSQVLRAYWSLRRLIGMTAGW
jgi:O-antigen/teichoic acid export membrane protein